MLGRVETSDQCVPCFDWGSRVGEAGQLTELGLPASLPRLDAAFVWGKNGVTYLFSGAQYWRWDRAEMRELWTELDCRYDEDAGRVEAGYPRHIRAWRGVPAGLAGAVTWRDGIHYTQHTALTSPPPPGRTYFFQGGRYWRFNDEMVITEREQPRTTAADWLDC